MHWKCMYRLGLLTITNHITRLERIQNEATIVILRCPRDNNQAYAIPPEYNKLEDSTQMCPGKRIPAHQHHRRQSTKKLASRVKRHKNGWQKLKKIFRQICQSEIYFPGRRFGWGLNCHTSCETRVHIRLSRECRDWVAERADTEQIEKYSNPEDHIIYTVGSHP